MDKSNDYADELKDKLDTLLGTINKSMKNLDWKVKLIISSRKIKFYDVKNDGETLIEEGKSKFYDAKK
jgi:hypothetical protein